MVLAGRPGGCPWWSNITVPSLPCMYCSYFLPPCQVVGLLRELVSHLGPEDRDKVFYSTARDFYKLKL